jgi:hypothetical protein
VTMSTLSIQDQVVDHGEGPLLLTNLSPVNYRFACRNLLGTTVSIDGQEVVVLLDSGCEAKLVLSRVFADNNLIKHRPIGMMVGVDSVGLGDRRGCDECKELLEREQWLAL